MDLTPIVLAHEDAFTIGSVEVRPATREIVGAPSTVIVEPRVMQLLVALRRADGGVLSKDDLAKLCWEGRIVGEDAINRVVSRLRAVAEKDAGGQFRIETITKVGYRLIGASGMPDSSGPSSQSRQPLNFSRRQTIVAGSAAAVAVATGGAGWLLLRRDRMPAEARILVDDAKESLQAGVVDQVSNAIGKLRHASELVPDNAEVWGLLAFAYIRLEQAAPPSQRADLRARGFAAMKRAFALQPNQPNALAAYARSVPVYRNWLACERTHRSALRLYPDQPDLLYGLAYVMAQVGRGRDGLESLERARRLVPTSPPLQSMRINALWDVGLMDEADSAMSEALKLWPRHFGIWFSNVYFLMYNGRADQAFGMLKDIATRPIGIPDWNFDQVAAQAKAIATRDAADLRKAIALSLEASHRGTGFAENTAVFAAYMGDLDTAFAALNALYFNGGFAMPDAYFAKEQGMYSAQERHTYILFRRPVAALRADPRFGRLTRVLGLDDYWQRTNSRSRVNS